MGAYQIFRLKKIDWNQGLTLPEVLLSMGLIAIIATPFLSSLFAVGRNSEDAEIALRASLLAQRVMEITKTRPLNPPVPLVENGLTATAQVTALETGSLNNNVTTYSNITVPQNFDITVDGDTVKVGGNTYSTSDSFRLVISSVYSQNAYTLYNETTGQNSDGQLDAQNRFWVTFKNTEGQNLNLEVQSNVSQEVAFCIADNNNSRMRLKNIGTRTIYEYDNLVSTGITDQYQNTLYRIQVNVTGSDGNTVSRLVSFVKQ